MNEIRILELFGGIGAPRCALEKLGHLAKSEYVELDQHAVDSYNQIFYDNKNAIDVKDFEASGKTYDLLVGGFPCQDISKAGKMKGMAKESKTRSNLAWELVRIVKECLPKTVVIENVANLLSKKFKKDFDEFISEFAKIGYKVSYQILNASDFGIPQKRERLFIVASLKEKFDFSKLEKKETKDIRKFVDFEYLDPGSCFVKQATKSGAIELKVPGVANLSFPTSKTRRGRVIQGGKISPTLLTSPEIYAVSSCKSDWIGKVCGIDASDFHVRPLTSLEYWRLMGFSDKQYERASEENVESQLYKQAGNSIVVDVLEALFKGIYKERWKHDSLGAF